MVYKICLFFYVELFANVDAFLYVVADAPLQLHGKPVLVRKLLEGLEVFALFEVLRTDVADKGPDPVDVVGETHHAEYLDEDEAEGLAVVGGRQVAEADSEHDVDSPVVGPDVLGKPLLSRDSLCSVPVVSRIELRHGREEDGQHVSETEVEEDHFD